MSLIVDANIVIAILDASDSQHREAVRRCLKAESIAILNLTRAEALIHPTRSGEADKADAILDAMGFETETLTDAIADRTRWLTASYGNKHFAIVDAAVVALGIEKGWTVLTADQKWPLIDGADIEVLT